MRGVFLVAGALAATLLLSGCSGGFGGSPILMWIAALSLATWLAGCAGGGSSTDATADGTPSWVGGNGNPVESDASITVHLSGGSAGATLYGTLTVPAVGGFASFADLEVSLKGTGYHLDGDGILDLVAANYEGADVSVLIGRGDGTFASEGPTPWT